MKDPIKYLDFYTEHDHNIFFGCGQETDNIINLLKEFPVIILCGESGTGKSSLLQAGIMPRLKNDVVLYHRLGHSSRSQLNRELQNLFPGKTKNREDFSTQLKSLEQIAKQQEQHLIIILDQFEEILVQPKTSKSWLPASSLIPIFDSQWLRIIFCMRSDYLPLFMDWLKPTRLHFRAEQFLYLRRFSRQKCQEILKGIFDFHKLNIPFACITRISELLAELDIQGLIYPPHIQIVAGYIKAMVRQEKKAIAELFGNRFKVENILTGYFDKELFRGFDYQAHDIVRDLLDTLVGREGLRRKYTVEEICRQLNTKQSLLKPIVSQLIKKRVLRRTQENRYELIHDFLSRHFFSSFSFYEKRKRRLQDMYYAALMDFKDANILLDEKRLRLFLHYKELLNIDTQGQLLLVQSIIPVNYFGFDPYIDITMFDCMIQLFKKSRDNSIKQSIAKKLFILAGYKQEKIIKELFLREQNIETKINLLNTLELIDPLMVETIITDYLGNWQNQTDMLLDMILTALKNSKQSNLLKPVIEIFKQHPSDNIKLQAIDIIRIIIDHSTIKRLLDLFNEEYYKSNKVLDVLTNEICSLFLDEFSSDQYLGDKTTYLEKITKIIKTDSKKIVSGIIRSYILLAQPASEECEKLLDSLVDIVNIEYFVNTVNESKNPQYLPLLFRIIENNTDTTLHSNIIRTFSSFNDRRTTNFLTAYFKKTKDKYLKTDILNTLIETDSASTLSLSREIFQQSNPESDLVFAALTGLKRYGDETDLKRLEELVLSASEQNISESALESIDQFNPQYATAVNSVLKNLWQKVKSEYLRTTIACKLIIRKDFKPLTYLIQRINLIDESTDLRTQDSFLLPQREPVAQIIKTLIKVDIPLPEQDILIQQLQELVEMSANRIIAQIAVLLLGIRFTQKHNLKDWLLKQMKTANRPEIRGMAALALAVNPPPDILGILQDNLNQAPWPICRRFSLYALGILKLDHDQHEKRMQILSNYIGKSKNYNLCDHAIWVYCSCAYTQDIKALEIILEKAEIMLLFNQYFQYRIEKTINSIKNMPLKQRQFPPLHKIFEPDNYQWRHYLNLFPWWL